MLNLKFVNNHRSSTPQVIHKLTERVFALVSQMTTEMDRKIFSILLSMEVEAAANRLQPGEREFIISPAYGAQLVQAINNNKPMSEHRYWQTKKTFDWMTDEQFLHLQYLAISHAWFSDAFDRMARDGRESSWRNLCEAESPENMTLPDKLDETLNATQRFCIIRAVRGERIIQLALSYVASVLGKRCARTLTHSLFSMNIRCIILLALKQISLFVYSFIASSKIDFDALLAESAPNKPIVLTYSEEPDTLKRFFVQCSKSKAISSDVTYSIVDVNALGLSDEMHIKRAVIKAIDEVRLIISICLKIQYMYS